MMLTALEWLGCIFGVLGALMLALNNRASGWGWVAFLVSNAFWLAFGLVTDTRGLVAIIPSQGDCRLQAAGELGKQAGSRSEPAAAA